MQELQLDELLEGMVVGRKVLKNNGEILLKEGDKVTGSTISTLLIEEINKVWVLDPYTLAIDPFDVARKELKRDLAAEILMVAPASKEANMNDEMAEYSRMAVEISSKIAEQDKVLKYLLNMKILDQNYYLHAVRTCALSILTAGAMKLGPKEVFYIATAAILHDIGLIETPYLIKNRPKSAQEEAQWREHATYGYYLALDGGIKDDIAVMIKNHHETWCGDGFPEGAAGENIPVGARIINVCQSYDHLIRYEGVPPYEAIEYLYGAGGVLFDSEITKIFTENIAVYPLGSMVRLTSGEVGVVVNIRANKGPRPIITLYYDAMNKPFGIPKEVDLGKERTLFIKEVL